MPASSNDAPEVLDVMAPFLHTGPTTRPRCVVARLTVVAFEHAVQELDTLGLGAGRRRDVAHARRRGLDASSGYVTAAPDLPDFSLLSNVGSLGSASGIFGIAIDVFIIVALVVPASSAWFRSRARPAA